MVRNRVYARVFDEEWVDRHLPVNWQRIARAAWTAVVTISLPLAIVAVIMWLRAERALEQAQRSQRHAEGSAAEAERARDAEKRSRRRQRAPSATPRQSATGARQSLLDAQKARESEVNAQGDRDKAMDEMPAPEERGARLEARRAVEEELGLLHPHRRVRQDRGRPRDVPGQGHQVHPLRHRARERLRRDEEDLRDLRGRLRGSARSLPARLGGTGWRSHAGRRRGSFAGPGRLLGRGGTLMSRPYTIVENEETGAGTTRRPPPSARRHDSGPLGRSPRLPATPRPCTPSSSCASRAPPPPRRVLSSRRSSSGASRAVGLLLDHHTVSRRHAEMVCDPFGRWWIRDLGSTNGTHRQRRAHRRRAGALARRRIGIGDFSLAFLVEAAAERPREPSTPAPTTTTSPPSSAACSTSSRPRIAAAHLRTLLEFSQRLIAIDERRTSASTRSAALIVRDDFHAANAVVIRRRGPTPLPPALARPPRRRARPPPPAPPSARSTSRAASSTCCATRASRCSPATSTTRFDGRPDAPSELTMARDVMELWVLACPSASGGDAHGRALRHPPPRLRQRRVAQPLRARRRGLPAERGGLWAARRHAQEHAAIERELDTARQIQRGAGARQHEARLPRPRRRPSASSPASGSAATTSTWCPCPTGASSSPWPTSAARASRPRWSPPACTPWCAPAVDVQPSAPARSSSGSTATSASGCPTHSFVTMVAVSDRPRHRRDRVRQRRPPARARRRPRRRAAPTPVGREPGARHRPRRRWSPSAPASSSATCWPCTPTASPSCATARQGDARQRASARSSPPSVPRPPRRGRHRRGPGARLDDFREGELPEDDRAFLLAQRR